MSLQAISFKVKTINGQMSFFKQWILPFFVAIILVLVFRYFMFDFMIVSDELMKNSLKKGDLILIQKKALLRRNIIILIDTTKEKYSNPHWLTRCVAIPGDTLQIRNSVIFVNRKKSKLKTSRKTKILSHYIFKSDSNDIQELLINNNILFNQQLAFFGIYSFKTDQKKLHQINKQDVWAQKKKIIADKGLYSQKTAPFNKHFYWNNDNFGPLVVPSSRMTIKLNRATFELYKQIILKETGKSFILKEGIVYSTNKIIRHYTFQFDYYFVLNDNRSILNDSRNLGFIKKDQIVGKFIMKLF